MTARCANGFCRGRMVVEVDADYSANDTCNNRCDICRKRPCEALNSMAGIMEAQAKRTRQRLGDIYRQQQDAIGSPWATTPDGDKKKKKEKKMEQGVTKDTNTAPPSATYKCPECGQIADTLRDLGRHRHYKHGYKSPGYVRKTQRRLTLTEKQNDRKKQNDDGDLTVEYVCESCRKGFPSVRSLGQHKRNCTGISTVEKPAKIAEKLTTATDEPDYSEIAILQAQHNLDKKHLDDATTELNLTRAENARLVTRLFEVTKAVFPPFSRWWFPSVQRKWLEVYGLLNKPSDKA